MLGSYRVAAGVCAIHPPPAVCVSNPLQVIPRCSRPRAGKRLFEGYERQCAEPGMVPPRRLWLWQVADNLRKGAATNAVQIAEALLARRA